MSISDKVFHIALAFLIGIWVGVVVWALTAPPREVRHTYLHTTVCEYVIDEDYLR